MNAHVIKCRPVALASAAVTLLALLPVSETAHAFRLTRARQLASTTVLSTARAIHGPPGEEEPAPPDPDWVEAERLFRQGSARYSAANYSAAIIDFQAALELVAKHDYDPNVELALLVNLARAHRRAYEIDRDVVHLRTALEINRRVIRVTSEESDEATESVAAITEIEALLAALDSGESSGEEPEVASSGADRGSPKPAKKRSQPGTGLLAGGATLLVVGAGGVGLMGYGLSSGAKAESDGEKLAGTTPSATAITKIEDDGKLANTLAVVGGVVGAIGIAGGAALIGLGVRQRQRSKHVALAPVMRPGYAGLFAEMKF